MDAVVLLWPCYTLALPCGRGQVCLVGLLPSGGWYARHMKIGAN